MKSVVTTAARPAAALKVPRGDRTLLAVPPLDELPGLTDDNAAGFAGSLDVQGRPLGELRRWTRTETLRRAADYTRSLGAEIADPDPAAPLIAGGHQPELFHPGVWAKNFALGRTAQAVGGTALNLVIDSDLLPGTRVRVPAGSRERPAVDSVPFDRDRTPRPWSAATVRDPIVFDSFGLRLAESMKPWGLRPLAADHWGKACCGDRLAHRLTAFRRGVEGAWGLHNLEVPIGAVCESDPFLWFAGHLVAHAGRFREDHNAALDDYRAANGVKAENRPVPPLAAGPDTVELPFWVWDDANPVRRRVFVRPAGRKRVALTDGETAFAEFPLTEAMPACCAVEALRDLPARGVRLRTRALATTLFARLCLADLFLHGIGGAKYDEVTDGLIRRFFGAEPPGYGTVSATARLPFADPFGADPGRPGELRADLRDLRFNPDRHLPPSPPPSAEALVDRKQALIAEQKDAATHGLSRSERRARTPANAARRAALHAVNAGLAAHVAARAAAVRAELAETEARLAADKLLTSREFSFAVFPEATLRPFLTGILERVSPERKLRPCGLSSVRFFLRRRTAGASRSGLKSCSESLSPMSPGRSWTWSGPSSNPPGRRSCGPKRRGRRNWPRRSAGSTRSAPTGRRSPPTCWPPPGRTATGAASSPGSGRAWTTSTSPPRTGWESRSPGCRTTACRKSPTTRSPCCWRSGGTCPAARRPSPAGSGTRTAAPPSAGSPGIRSAWSGSAGPPRRSASGPWRSA